MEDNEYQTGDWGIAKFTYYKKGSVKEITAFGQITAIERKVLTFEDDCIEYIIERKSFTFEKKSEPV